MTSNRPGSATRWKHALLTSTSSTSIASPLARHGRAPARARPTSWMPPRFVTTATRPPRARRDATASRAPDPPGPASYLGAWNGPPVLAAPELALYSPPALSRTMSKSTSCHPLWLGGSTRRRAPVAAPPERACSTRSSWARSPQTNRRRPPQNRACLPARHPAKNSGARGWQHVVRPARAARARRRPPPPARGRTPRRRRRAP